MSSSEVIYRLRDISGLPHDIVAGMMKDVLKYGMLCWWYKSRDGQLFQLYALQQEQAGDALRREVIGSHTQRPYRML